MPSNLFRKALFFAVLSGFFFCSSLEESSLDVTYVANEGFLLESAGKKVLIDATFGGFEAEWCDVPSGITVGLMERGEAPFNDVDLIASTHAHLDHFNAEITAEHLINNSRCSFISTPDALDELKKIESFENFREAIIKTLPEKGAPVKMEVNGIGIKIFRIDHSKYMIKDETTREMYNRHEKVQNLGYIIELGDFKIWHGGDGLWSVEEVEKIGLAAEEIDLAFLHDGPPDRLFGIKEIIQPKHVILMHINPAGKEPVAASLREQQITDMTVFMKELEKRKIF